MTQAEAIAKAQAKSESQGRPWIAVKRTDSPFAKGDYFYAIAADDKHAWTPGETVIWK